MSEDLFGNTVPDESPAPTVKVREVNDMNTIIAVVTRASDKDAGYALLGPTRRVHRCGPPHQRADREATQAIFWEADTVHQLLRQGLLREGAGRHTYATRQGTQTGCAVLVPKSTTAQLARWKALTPLLPGKHTTRKKGA
jgi:hypothetical protein